MAEELHYRGVRYLRARVEPADSGTTLKPVFAVIAEDGARQWVVSQPEAWWRNFVDGDVGDPKQIRSAVRLYGFAFAPIDTTPGQEFTGRWHGLQAALKIVAGAWGALDSNGTSTIIETKRKEADLHIRKSAFIREHREELSLVHDPAGEPGKLVRQAGSLAAYMVASALHGLEHRLPMKVCQHCERWFHPGRTDQIYCSDAHRSQANIRRRLGIVPAR